MAVSLAGTDKASAAQEAGTLVPLDGGQLRKLTDQLARLPRRRDFKTVPMILSANDQWDAAALEAVIAYKSPHKQVWDNTEIGGPWLNLMRNSINAQVWSFKHPDFLAVSATHGTAHLALFDDVIWDKYQIAKLAGDKFPSNSLTKVPAAANADAKHFEDPQGVFSLADNSIPVLMKRGVVFLSCHNAIWEEAAALLKAGVNPDKLTQEQLAAELTNHLISGVVLTPGAVGTLPELQRAGFQYAK
ncbi:MAG: transcriptional initiation protein Tat [Hyphomicrobiales bacterium]|nr:transcriptional initiation protein Tat [Hyphomicrobiales bacterium]